MEPHFFKTLCIPTMILFMQSISQLDDKTSPSFLLMNYFKEKERLILKTCG